MSRFATYLAYSREALRLADRRFGPVLDLAVRLTLAGMFLRSGLLKLFNWDTALYLARTEYPVSWLDPVVAAYLGVAIEVICPLFIAVGLATRLAAVPLAILSLVIQFNYQERPEHLYWAILFGLMIVRGPGSISLDHFIGARLPLDGYVRPAYQLFIRLWLAAALWPVGILLALGFGTRIVALASIALLPDGPEQMFAIMLLAHLALRGADAISLDALVRRLFAKRYPIPRFEDLTGAPKVVIVGAGFGGLAAAKGLRHARAQVTVIDRRNYHLFQPLLYQVATASLSPAEIAQPIRGLLREQPNTRVLMERVSAVDWRNKEVIAGHIRVPYDHLVLATGARHDYFGKDDWQRDAPGLKKIDDATKMRARVLSAFEDAEAATDAVQRRAMLTFVIVGAGPTGVELAGAIVELARLGMAKDFRSFDPAEARVILVQSAPRVLPAFPEALSEHARRQLEALGIEVRLKARVTHVDEFGVQVDNERIDARTVLWAAGVMASPAAKWLGVAADRAGRIKVNADLSVPERPGVYAIGDTALVMNGENPVPGLAPAAKQGGAHVARLIAARIAGRELARPFRYLHMGSMATIGRKAAIAEFGALKLSGMIAWWLWGAVHVAFLVGARNRLTVMLDWAWSYLTYRRGIRLITGEIR